MSKHANPAERRVRTFAIAMVAMMCLIVWGMIELLA
jgi:hypothetical protein